MSRLGLLLAVSALVAAALPAPGLFVAIGLGIAAIGLGWVGYRRTVDPGFRRLAGAAAITIGAMGAVLGGLRLVLALAAIEHLRGLVG
jgi:hypothetical protein